MCYLRGGTRAVWGLAPIEVTFAQWCAVYFSSSLVPFAIASCPLWQLSLLFRSSLTWSVSYSALLFGLIVAIKFWIDMLSLLRVVPCLWQPRDNV